MTRKIFTTIVFGLLIIGFVWFVSTPAQRESYLALLNIKHVDHETKVISVRKQLAYKEYIPENKSMPSLSRYRGFQHPQVNFCQEAGARNPAQSIKTALFKWKDDQGVVNYSDQNPDDISDVEKVGEIFLRGNEYFSLSLSTKGFKLPPLFKDKLNARIYVIFKFFSQNLSPDHLSPVHINLHLIKGKRRFVRFRDKHTTGLDTTSGFYTTKNNMAVVRWSGEKRTLQVVQHEVAHLVIGNLFGNPPTWFNEGLAEFMERLESQQNITTAYVDHQALSLIKDRLVRNHLTDLQWLINSSRRDWENTDESLMYQYSWSVFYFLMSSSKGKDLIKNYLDYLAQNRCRRLDKDAFYTQQYPAGLTGLERDWRSWILKSKKTSIHF